MEGAGNDILLDGPRFDEPDLDRLSATIKRVHGGIASRPAVARSAHGLAE
jgi:hypothetical protein